MDVLDALARQDLVVLRERVRSNAAALGLDFGSGRPFAVDPVPRLSTAPPGRRWSGPGAAGKAVNAFLADVYGEQRILAADVVPERVLADRRRYEPKMRGLLDPEVPAATVAGLDLVRAAAASCWSWRTI